MGSRIYGVYDLNSSAIKEMYQHYCIYSKWQIVELVLILKMQQ